VLCSDVGRDGETESGAVFLGGEKGLEDAFFCFGSNAGSLIADFDAEAVGLEEAADKDGPIGRRCLNGVEDEVEKELLNLLGVALNLSRWLLRLQF
jgi:hypothetical protein